MFVLVGNNSLTCFLGTLLIFLNGAENLTQEKSGLLLSLLTLHVSLECFPS